MPRLWRTFQEDYNLERFFKGENTSKVSRLWGDKW